MRVSILVGAHNEGERLWRTVESILETVGRLDAELIVGDDGSTDGSIQELGRHFPQVLVVKQKKRLGVGAARGLAAGRARGDVLIFLDGHTKPEPGALERLVASVEKTRGKAVVTPQIVGLDETTWRSQPQQIGNGYALDLETFDSWWLPLKKMKEVKEGRQTFYESPALIGCALAVSRELYDRLWGFDQHMRQWGSEDVDFALKAWTMGARVLHDPGATVAHRFQRYFGDYEVSAEYPLANQIRTARKHFTQSVWEDWLVRAQEQQRRRLKDHPEGLWASAWEVFQRDRQSAEHERAYLLSRRPQDEFWYAKRFDRSWPTMGGAASLLAQPALPPHVLFARPEASPAPVLISIDPDQGGQGQTVPVTLSGSNFDGVTINAPSGVTPSISSQDATTIDGTFDISATAPLNTRGTVSVTNASGLQSNTVTFAILVTPSITSISPNNGVQGATVPITLTGTGLQSPTFNSIPGITVTNQDNVSNTEITADFVIASNATTGVVQVSVTNEGGGITSNSVGFTINPAVPHITSIAPAQGAQGGTVPVVISGTSFVSATINAPSGISATISSQTQTQINATFVVSPFATIGTDSISVTNQNGQISNSVNFAVTCGCTPFPGGGRGYSGAGKLVSNLIGIKASIKTRYGNLCCHGTSSAAAFQAAYVNLSNAANSMWAQSGWDSERNAGSTTAVNSRYAEVQGSQYQVKYDTSNPPAQESVHAYQCDLNSTTGTWTFSEDGTVWETFQDNGWKSLTGGALDWLGEILNLQDDMPGTATDKCTFTGCEYRVSGQSYQSAALVSSNATSSNPSQWGVTVVSATEVDIWDINPNP
jgi:GT2 family glycosyltransferase